MVFITELGDIRRLGSPRQLMDYTDKDFKLHVNDGSLVTMKDKVRVSGKLIYSPSSSILFEPIDVQRI